MKFIKEFFGMSRYIALGTLDGILAVMGIVLTSSGISGSVSHMPNYVIGLTGLSGGIALAMSNAFGSFLGERAVETRTLRELEKKMLVEKGKLDGTVIHEQAKHRIYMSVFVHGFSSFIGAFVPALPFLLLNDRIVATMVTLLLSMISLGLLGIYLGVVAKENVLKTCIEVLALGTLIGLIASFLGALH